nr:ABC transporter substrate-binding protein [Neorhizobium lilium]
MAAIETGEVQVSTANIPLTDVERLKDEAGYKRGADGFRFKLFIDPTQPSGPPKQTAEYFAQALGKVGIKVELRSQDFATFVKRIFTDRMSRQSPATRLHVAIAIRGEFDEVAWEALLHEAESLCTISNTLKFAPTFEISVKP